LLTSSAIDAKVRLFQKAEMIGRNRAHRQEHAAGLQGRVPVRTGASAAAHEKMCCFLSLKPLKQ
jgi:hypothetical protein